MDGLSNNYIPRQKLEKSKKTKDWGKQVIDSLEGYMYSDNQSGRTSGMRKQVNYELYNGKLDPADFEYVTNPYGVKKNEFPANLQHYDIISPKLNLLIGEEIKRPLNFRAVTTNSDAITEIEEEKKGLIDAELQKLFEQVMQGGVPGEQGPPQPPEELERFLKFEYQDVREKTAHDILKYLEEKERLLFKFNDGFKDALIGGEEIYWVGVVNGQPVVRVANPCDITVINDPDSQYIEDAQAVIEERFVNIGTVIDEFYSDLTPQEIDQLEQLGGFGSGNGQQKDFMYHASQIRIQGDEAYKRTHGQRTYVDGQGNIRIVRIEWKSMKKIGFLQTLEAGEEEWDEDLVDEGYKIPSGATKDKDGFYNWTDALTDAAMRLKWDWVNEYWEGTKIGEDIYVNIQAKPNQRRSLDNPALCKCGYVGYLYNARNAESVSLIDRMKPFQYLYNILMYRTELAFAKSKGKAAIMDIAQIPRSEGWDIDSWMYYLEAMGIMFINSHEEGKQGQQNNFNQFTSIDLTMGDYINQNISMLNQIKSELEELTGVSRQRMGQISSSELVGNTERAVSQSSHITEYWFAHHDEVKRRVYEALLDVAKIAWKGGKKMQYVLSDMSRVFIDLEDNPFPDTEYGIFITNGSKDIKTLETLRMAAQQSMQSGNLHINEFAKLLSSDSVAEITRTLEFSQDRAEKQQQAQMQQEQEHQTQLQQMQQQTQMEIQTREDARVQANNDTKIEIAHITANAKLMDTDLNNNGVRDEYDREKFMRQAELETQKLADAREAKQRELAIKERDLELKREALNKRNTGK